MRRSVQVFRWGALIRQFRYQPYGSLTGIDGSQSDGTTLGALDADTPIDAWHLFQGMFYDEEGRDPNTDPAHFGGKQEAMSKSIIIVATVKIIFT